MKKIIIIIAICVLIVGCSPAMPEATSRLTRSETPVSTTTLVPTATSSPTITSTPTTTPTSTITPTPTATKIAGGTGFVLGDCESKFSQTYPLDLISNEYNSTYSLDLISNEYNSVLNLTQTDELWESTRILGFSPTRDHIIWTLSSRTDLQTKMVEGREITKYWSWTEENYISEANNFEQANSFNIDPPDLWLPGDIGLFFEDDLSVNYPSLIEGLYIHPVNVFIGSYDGRDKIFLETYRNADWSEGRLSPDGRYYAFLTRRININDDNDFLHYIVVVNLLNRSLKEYPYHAFGNLSWSPDNSNLYYDGMVISADNKKYWGGLYILYLTNGQTQLLRDRSYATLSPNGEILAGYDNNIKTAFLMKPDGTDFLAIELPASSVRHGIDEIQWLQDSSGFFIDSSAYYTNSASMKHLLFYDVNSGKTTFIYEFPDYEGFSGKRMFPSPDGKWIILRTTRQMKEITRFLAIQTYWHVCNSNSCTEFLPPDTTRCFRVEWAGAYPIESLNVYTGQ